MARLPPVFKIGIYHVYHADKLKTNGDDTSQFPSGWTHVADVEANSLDDAYELTNNIEQSWINNPQVAVFGSRQHRRSTSCGDVLVAPDGFGYRCDVVGWGRFELPPSLQQAFVPAMTLSADHDPEEEEGPVAAASGVEYRFFWGGAEFQLMSFPDEDLIGVYGTGHRTSFDQAMKDVRNDMESRGIRTCTVNVDTSKG